MISYPVANPSDLDCLCDEVGMMPEERLALRLAWCEALPWRLIAARMGVSERTAQRRLMSGTEALIEHPWPEGRRADLTFLIREGMRPVRTDPPTPQWEEPTPGRSPRLAGQHAVVVTADEVIRVRLGPRGAQW